MVIGPKAQEMGQRPTQQPSAVARMKGAQCPEILVIKKQSADPNNLIKIAVTGKLHEIGQNQRKQTALKIEF